MQFPFLRRIATTLFCGTTFYIPKRRVLAMLAEIRSRLQERGTAGGVATDGDQLWSASPCETVEEFSELEEELKALETRQKMIRYLLSVGGSSLRDNVERMLLKVMTVTLLGNFNMNGQSRRNVERKHAFKNTAVYSVMKASVNKELKTTEKEFDDVLAKILKYSPDRKGGSGRSLYREFE